MENASRFEAVEVLGGFVVHDSELERWCGRCGWCTDQAGAARDPFGDEPGAKVAVLLDVDAPSPAAERDASGGDE